MEFNKKILLTFVLTAIVLAGCRYSFTGASVPPHLKTIAIPIFKDRSGSGEPTLRDDFTNQLIQKFIDDNSLQVTDKSNANALLECTIISLRDAPAIISGGEKVTTRRVTITVQAVYKDLVKRKTIFNKNFSNFGDYNNEGDIQTLREQAIQKAVDLITDDILLAVVSNW